MKKINLFIISILLSPLALLATNIDVTHARQVAGNFYQLKTGNAATMSLAYQCLNTDASNGVPLGDPIYYVFNAAGGNGFVMVSGDDVVKPILGYDTHGQFSLQNAPPNITDWFGKYSKQIAYAKVNLTAATPDISAAWTSYYNNTPLSTRSLRSGTGPLLSTTWDQGAYYNAMCPTDPTGPAYCDGHTLTGCGATAMSQIMRYWSYPPTGTGTNSYDDATGSGFSNNYGTQTVNFGATTYNWANMPFSVTSANTDVATIMYSAGVAVDMDYGPNESSSYMVSDGVHASCQDAYTSYFGYDAGIQGLTKSNYPTESVWTGLIETELDASRPIQYAGHGTDGGHTFVLDGDDGSGDYHINWGWSGVDNGYYGIDALIPGPSANGDFSQGEQMIIGIQPPHTVVTAATIVLDSAIGVPATIGFENTFSVYAELGNNGTSSFAGSYCAAMFDATGTFIRFIGDILTTGANPLQAGYYYSYPGLAFNDTTSFITVPGTYTIGIYFAPTSATTWTLAGESTFTNPVTVTVGGAADPGIALYSNISPSPTTFVQGQAASVSVNLTNDGTATYFGQYEAALLDLQGNVVEALGTYSETTGLPVNDHYSNPISFSAASITASEGSYILAIAEEAQGTTNWYYCGGQNYPNPILVSVINNGFNTAVNNLSASTVKVYPDPARDRINVDAGEVKGSYTLTIYNTIGQQMSQSSGNLNGQKLSEDVSHFAEGLYTIQLQTESGVLNSRFVVRQ